MFAATQQIASVAGLKATKVQVCILLLLVLSFFLFNTTDLIIGVFFSQRRRAFDDDAIFLLPYLILQKRIDVCDDARERDLISDAARCWSHRGNERKRIRVTLLLVVALCVRGRRIRNASIEISLNFDEKKIFSFESSRERKKSSIFDLILSRKKWLMRD